MRVNEENFLMVESEDLEQDKASDWVHGVVDSAIAEHNDDSKSHSDIRREMAQVKMYSDEVKAARDAVKDDAEAAFGYMTVARDNATAVAGIYDETVKKSNEASGAATKAQENANSASASATAAADAREKAETARDAAVHVYPRIIDGYWHVFDWEKGDVFNSGIPATGPQGEKGEDGYTPQRGEDYWTDGDKTEIVDVVKGYVDNYVDERTKEVTEALFTLEEMISENKEKIEPFVITFASRIEETDTGYVEQIFGDKTFDEVKEALEQGKSFVGCNLWGLRVNFTVVPDISMENAISLTALTGDIITVTCTCWKDKYPENNGWNVVQTSVVTIVNDAIRLGVLDSWEVAV